MSVDVYDKIIDSWIKRSTREYINLTEAYRLQLKKKTYVFGWYMYVFSQACWFGKKLYTIIYMQWKTFKPKELSEIQVPILLTKLSNIYWGTRTYVIEKWIYFVSFYLNVNFDWLFTVLRPAQKFFTFMETSGLQNLGPCSALRAFEQGGIFIVPHLLWHGASVLRSHQKDRPIQSPLTTH
jgi:hypothetical protein